MQRERADLGLQRPRVQVPRNPRTPPRRERSFYSVPPVRAPRPGPEYGVCAGTRTSTDRFEQPFANPSLPAVHAGQRAATTAASGWSGTGSNCRPSAFQLRPEISTTRAYATRTRVSTQPAQGSYAEASATPMEAGTMSIPPHSSHLIASARCYRHDYLVMDRRSTATLICDRGSQELLPYAGQLVAERDRLGQLARRRSKQIG